MHKSGDVTPASARSFGSDFLGYLSQYIAGADLNSTMSLTGSDADTGLNISRDVGSLKVRGDARVKLAGNVDSIELREGDHDLRLKVQNNTIEVDVFDGERIDLCEGKSAETDIVMEGIGRVRKTDIYAGIKDITTGDRWTDSINSWETENTIHIRTGGIGSMAISDNAGDLEIIYDGGTILLEDLAGQVLSVSDFVFV